MKSTIKEVLFYDNRTNEVVKNLFEGGITAEDFQEVINLLEYVHIPNCDRVQIVKSEYASTRTWTNTVLLVRIGEKWHNCTDAEKDILGLQDREKKSFRVAQLLLRKNIEELSTYSRNDDLSHNLLFWSRRTEVMNVLLELDLANRVCFPTYMDESVAYAVESYDIAKAIENVTDYSEIKKKVQEIYSNLNGVKLNRSQLSFIAKRICHKSEEHICPICRKHIFVSETSRGVCPVCEWKNDIDWELNLSFKHGNQEAGIGLRKAIQFLLEQDNCAEVTKLFLDAYKQEKMLVDDLATGVAKIFFTKYLKMDDKDEIVMAAIEKLGLLIRFEDAADSNKYKWLRPIIKRQIDREDASELATRVTFKELNVILSEHERDVLAECYFDTLGELYEVGSETLFEMIDLSLMSKHKIVNLLKFYGLDVSEWKNWNTQ